MGLWSTNLHIIIVIAGGGSFPVAFLSWWLYVGQVSPPLGSETHSGDCRSSKLLIKEGKNNNYKLLTC